MTEERNMDDNLNCIARVLAGISAAGLQMLGMVTLGKVVDTVVITVITSVVSAVSAFFITWGLQTIKSRKHKKK